MKIEQDVEIVQKVINRLRSARSDYNIPRSSKTEGKAYTQVLSNCKLIYFW